MLTTPFTMAAPEVCAVEVSTLPATGSGVPGLWLGLGAVLLVFGLVVLFVAWRRGRPGSPWTAAGLVLLAGLLLAPSVTPPALAAPGEVSYSDGCALIGLEPVEVNPPGASSLLPGDSLSVITATVTNRYDGPISLNGRVLLDADSALAPLLDTDVYFDGVSGPVTLAAGDSAQVVAVVSLPTTASDAVQGLSSAITLRLEASAQ